MSSQTILWIGEKKLGKFVDSSDNVMDSLYFYLGDSFPRVRYPYNRLFLDNGAYSATRKGLELDPERVKDIQEDINPDLTIPLDYPFAAGMSKNVMQRRWCRTRNNYIEWQETTSLNGRLVPILHAWSVHSLISNVIWLQKHADTDLVAIGSLVCFGYDKYKGYFGDRQPRKELVDMIINAVQAIRKYSDFKIHISGFGSSPLTLHLGYFCGINSTDTTGYRRKAAYGKINLLGTGDRHIGRKGARWGARTLDEKEKQLLLKCKCPVCKNDQSRLWISWEARAVHNKYILKVEEKRAKEYLEAGRGAYQTFLDNMFRETGLSYLWKYAKTRINYQPIDLWSEQ